ncbi:MAG TPA: prepilin-type N-terminal cleavage/methylation domain-containing protein [Patescibacteria group bacterium]|nr:prepilin-type N-terminal cleavage/methylation domain-containing protein [Patescibacteria group bacterium]
MKKFSAQYSHSGFTLIELLVVISIIGILATLISANLNSARSRARDAQRKSDLRSIETALRLYYNDTGSYPTNNVSGEIMGNAGGAKVDWGSVWAVGGTTYISKLPKDPLDGQLYKYEANSATDTYTLSACLENKSDASGVVTADASWCPSLVQFQINQQ